MRRDRSGKLDPEGLSAVSLWIAAFGYTAQLYCDFSGYTDLHWIAMLLGFTLPPRSPMLRPTLGTFETWTMSFSRLVTTSHSTRGAWCSPIGISLNLFLTFSAYLARCIHGLCHLGSGSWSGSRCTKRDGTTRKRIDPLALPLQRCVFGWLYTISFITLSASFFDLQTWNMHGTITPEC